MVYHGNELKASQDGKALVQQMQKHCFYLSQRALEEAAYTLRVCTHQSTSEALQNR